MFVEQICLLEKLNDSYDQCDYKFYISEGKYEYNKWVGNAQEAKYLQKIDDGLVKTFEIIEKTIKWSISCRNFSYLPEERYADVKI